METTKFSVSEAANDEFWLEMEVDGEYVGQVDYCPPLPACDLAVGEEPGLVTVWRIYVDPDYRGCGYAVRLLEELRNRVKVQGACTLELDMGTYAANRVVAKWLDVPVNDSGMYSL